MRVVKLIPGFLLTLALVLSCEADKEVHTSLDNQLITAIENSSTDGTLDYFVLPESDDYDALPQDPRNPLNPAKVKLGNLLFYETGLGLDARYESGKQTYSCASCHLANVGFTPGAIQGVADGGQGMGVNGIDRKKNPEYADNELDVQNIRPLSVLNTAFVTNTLWNGQFGATHLNAEHSDVFGEHIPDTEINELGYEALEGQNIEGLELHRMIIDLETMTELGYKDLFDEAFPEIEPEHRYSDLTGSFALSAFLRTQLSNRAPFQQWLKGGYTAMTEQEKRGAMVFFDEANCSSCHSEKNLGSNRFFALGVKDLHDQPSFNRNPDSEKNTGRGGFTGNPEDLYKFRVPQLYNVGDYTFYFHGSSRSSLEEVVDYFDKAVPENDRIPKDQIATQFQPLHLSDKQKEDLIAFLENGLRDPDLDRYVPDEVLSGLCFPNNDSQSKQDMGCY